VLLHCGLISAQSAGTDKGATFIVELPVVLKKDVLVVEAFDHGELDSASKHLQSSHTVEGITESRKAVTVRRVLVVDDASSNRKMLCRYYGFLVIQYDYDYFVNSLLYALVITLRILVNCGCECVEADDGSTCITTMKSDSNFELILLDFEMPGTSIDPYI